MVKNDTLYLYCIPNNQKTELDNTKNQFVKQNSDNPSSKTTGQSVLKKVNLFSDYNSDVSRLNFNTFQSSSALNISFNNPTTLKGFATKHLQPPDLFI